MPRTAKDWRNFGDVNFPEHGGRLVRYAGDGHVHVIELYTDLDGDENTHAVSAYDIDMRDFSETLEGGKYKRLADAVLEMCGTTRADFREDVPNGLERVVQLAMDAVSYCGSRWRVYDDTCSSKGGA